MTLRASEATEKMKIKSEPLSEDENQCIGTLPSSKNTPVMRLMPHMDFSKTNRNRNLKDFLCRQDSESEDSSSDKYDYRPKKGKVQRFGGSKGKMKCFATSKVSDTNNFNRMITNKQTKTLDDYNKFLSVARGRKEASFLEVLLSKNTPEEASVKQKETLQSGFNSTPFFRSNAMTKTIQNEDPPDDNSSLKIKAEALSDEEKTYEGRTYDEKMDTSRPSMVLPYMDYSEANFEESSEEDVEDVRDEDDEEWRASEEETEESLEEEKSQDCDSDVLEESDDLDSEDSDFKERKSKYEMKYSAQSDKKSRGKLGDKLSMSVKPVCLQTQSNHKVGDSIEEYNQLLSIARGSKDISYLQFLLSKNTRNEIKDLAEKRKESKYLKNKVKNEEKTEVIETLRRRNLLPSTVGPDIPYPVIDSCAKLLQLENEPKTLKHRKTKSSSQGSQNAPRSQSPLCNLNEDNSDPDSKPARKLLDGLNSRSCLLLQHLLVKEQKQSPNVSQPSSSSLVPDNSYSHSEDESVLRSMLTGKTKPKQTVSSSTTVPQVKATLLKDLLVANPAPLADYSEDFFLAKSCGSEMTHSSSPKLPKPQKRLGKKEELSPKESIEGYMVYVNRSCNEDDPIEDEENVGLTSDPSDERVLYTPAASCSEGDDNNTDDMLPNVTIKSEPLSPSSNMDENYDTFVGQDSGADYQVVVKQELSPVHQHGRLDDQDVIKKSYEGFMVKVKSEPRTCFDMEEKIHMNPENRHCLKRDSSLRNLLEDRNKAHQALHNAKPNSVVTSCNEGNPIGDEGHAGQASTASDPSEERASYTPAAFCSDRDNNPDETQPNVTIKSEPLSPSSNLVVEYDTLVGQDSGTNDQVVVRREPSPLHQHDRLDDQDAIKTSYEGFVVKIKSEPRTSFDMAEKRKMEPGDRHILKRDSSLRNILEDRNNPEQALHNAKPNSVLNSSSSRSRIVEPVSAAAQLMSLSKASSNKQETILKGLINGSSTTILGLDSSQEHTYNTRHKRKYEGTSLLEKALKTLKPNFPARTDMSSPSVRESPDRSLPPVQPGYFSSKLSEAVLMSSSEAKDSQRTIPPVASCSQQLLNIIKNVGASQQKPETKNLTLLKTMLNDKGSVQTSKTDLNTESPGRQYRKGQNTNLSSQNEISPRSVAFTTIPSQSQVRSNFNVVKCHTVTREPSPGNTVADYVSGPRKESPPLTSSSSRNLLATKCPYQCRICGNAFRSTSLLEDHMQVHFGAMPFGCTLCHKSFMTSRELGEHMSVHAKELSPAVVYKCTVCGIVFDTAEEHKKHRINHELSKPVLFNCNTCNKCFATREILQEHMKQHQTPAKEQTSEKYTGSCKHCNKEFKKHSKFVRHMTLHSALKEYKYKCEKCKKGFVTKTGMAGHIAKCQGPAYACSGCGKSFIRKIELCAHFQDVHKVTGTRCECCYKMFCFSYQKEEHLKEHEHDQWTVISKKRKDPKNSGVFAPLESKDIKLSVNTSKEHSLECMTDSDDDIEIISDGE